MTETTDDTPSADAPTDDTSPARTRILPREMILLAVAVLGVVGTLVFFGKWRDLDQQESERASVVTTSQAFAEALFTFDHTTLNEDFDRIIDFAVEDFAEEADDVFSNEDTRRALIENRVGSRAEAVDVFVQSVEGDRARAFVVVDQRVANADFPEPVADTVRVNLGLAKKDGKWKIADVTVVTGPGRAVPAVPTAGLPDGG